MKISPYIYPGLSITPAIISPRLQIHDVIDMVCDYTRVPKSKIIAKNSTAKVGFARNLAMYLCSRMKMWSRSEIANEFNRSHASPDLAIARIMSKWDRYKDDVEYLSGIIDQKKLRL